jgi:hypothetical protein
MDRQRIAKHWIESNEMDFSSASVPMTLPQNDAESLFYRFVDKNPLFSDNSGEAVIQYLLASRKQHHISGSHS